MKKDCYVKKGITSKIMPNCAMRRRWVIARPFVVIRANPAGTKGSDKDEFLIRQMCFQREKYL